MTVTEVQVAHALINALRGLAVFSDADVVDNDWRILDGPKANAPYALVHVADEFDMRPTMTRGVGSYTIPVDIIVAFGAGWQATMQQLRTTRQAAIGLMDTAPTLGMNGVEIRGVRSAGEIVHIYHQNDDRRAAAHPLYVSAPIAYEVGLF